MQMKMRPRYYCDHCQKGSGSPSAMRRHEASCTLNTKRICRFCGNLTDIPELTAILLHPGDSLESWQTKMECLREVTENCPGCILAAIRQSGVQSFGDPDDPASGGIHRNHSEGMFWNTPLGDHAGLGFNFQNEAKAYLNERAERLHDERYY